MEREGDRGGPAAPRRSPQELAETLAALAASTPEPPARPRRGGPGANQRTPGTAWSGPAETFPHQRDQVTPGTPAPTRAVLEQEVVLAPESELEAPASDEATLAPAAAVDDPDPELDAPAPSQPSETKSRVSNGTPARTRLHSRAGGGGWQRQPRSRSRGGLRIGGWRRSGTPRSAGDRANRGSRNVRRLYPPLLVVLLIVLVVALVDRGGGGSSKPSAQSASAPQSVFPTPSTVPTPTPPPVAVPTTPSSVAPPPTGKQLSIGTQGKPCRSLQVSGRAVSVSILQGQVTCRRARAVVLAFKSGKGRHRGSPGHRYVTVRGWRCGTSGTCTRPGKSIKAS
jgi:hypothetical protein